MQRNTRMIAAAGLIPVARELRAVCRGRVFLDDIGDPPLTGSHRAFKAVLEIDGSIKICGHPWPDGFPSYPLAAVWNLVEGRRPLTRRSRPRGWPYWHYLDEVTGTWENLSRLWRGHLENLMRLPQRVSRNTMEVVHAELDSRFAHGGQRLY